MMGPPKPTGRLRSQTATIDESSATNNMADNPLPDDTPSWGKSLYNLLNDSIQALDKKVTNFQTSLETVTKTADAAYELAQSNKSDVDSLSAKFDLLASKVDNYISDAVEFLLSENKKRDEHILRNESYSRRENLVFRGYKVTRDDPESSEDKVRKIIKAMGIPNEQSIRFQRCHYLNDKKQIIVRFQQYADRDRIWLNRYKLKQTTYYVAEDFPNAIISQRRQLYPVYKAAKNMPKFHRKVSMRGEKLVLDGRNYTCQDTDDLPPEINPGKLAQRENDTTIVFGGSSSSHHVLSNFYNVKNNFVYEHRSYSSSEQAFQHKKARVAGDQNKQREIMFNADPVVQKNLGQDVKGLDQASWNDQKCLVMKDILLAKFTQHDHLKKHLIDTNDKTLAEANGRDSYFAIGLPLTHPDVLDSSKWADNSNRLGKILMEIRQELRSELS